VASAARAARRKRLHFGGSGQNWPTQGRNAIGEYCRSSQVGRFIVVSEERGQYNALREQRAQRTMQIVRVSPTTAAFCFTIPRLHDGNEEVGQNGLYSAKVMHNRNAQATVQTNPLASQLIICCAFTTQRIWQVGNNLE